MSKQIYTPQNVSLAFNGVPLKSFVSLTVERNADNMSTTPDIYGKHAFTVNPDKSGALTLELQQADYVGNAVFAGIDLAQKEGQELIFMTVTVSDPSGSLLATLEDVVLQKFAPSDLSSEAGTRSHTFFVEDLTYIPVPESIGETVADAVNAVAAVDAIKNFSATKLGL
ncbi:hypothetical protein [Pseudoalteromonas phage J2-1_QLiu-2017]|nr:hypothetical protein [Pseudoalteromonas phage J2-1_QLiu-2017]